MPMTPENATWFADAFSTIVNNVGQALLDKEDVIKLALTTMLSEGHLLLEEHATRLALRSNDNALVELDIAGGETLLALAKDVQRHPIRPGVQHVDFLLVDRNERVDVEVPVTVIGEAAPGTIHMIEAATVMVSAPAVSVPEAIEVDVTGVAAGTVLTLADITLPKGVEAVSDAETAVVNVANEHAVASEVTEDAPAEGDAEAEAE